MKAVGLALAHKTDGPCPSCLSANPNRRDGSLHYFVIAYTFKGAVYCRECAEDLSEEGRPKSAVAVFGDTEVDSPWSCKACGEFIETGLTDRGIEYVCEALREFFLRSDRRPWRDWGDHVAWAAGSVGDRHLLYPVAPGVEEFNERYATLCKWAEHAQYGFGEIDFRGESSIGRIAQEFREQARKMETELRKTKEQEARERHRRMTPQERDAEKAEMRRLLEKAKEAIVALDALRLLGLTDEITHDDFRERRRGLLAKWHPDKEAAYVADGGDGKEFERMSARVQEALNYVEAFIQRRDANTRSSR